MASHLGVSTGVLAKEVKIFKLDFEVLDRTGRYADIVGVAVVVICDGGCSEFV